LLAFGALLLTACAGGGGRGSSWPGLAADGQYAYLSDGGQVYGVDLSDGSEVWHYPAKASPPKLVFYATPVVLPDGSILIGSAGTDSCMHKIDPSTINAQDKTAAGTCFFDGAKDHWIAAPLVMGDVIYAPNNDGFLYVIDATKGSLLWSLNVDGHLWATPVSDGKTLYLSSLDHNLYAVDIERRAVIWKTNLGGSITGSPALSEDGQTLFVGSFGARVFALNAQTGTVLWDAQTDGWVWGGPAVREGTVYAADLEGQVYAIDAETGTITWTVKPVSSDSPNRAITGTPLITDQGIIIDTESGEVCRVDFEGKAACIAKLTKGKVYTPAIPAGELILVAPLPTGAEFFLSAFSPDGDSVWHFTPEK
jgi:outer membrane protein assembly factor BamB